MVIMFAVRDPQEPMRTRPDLTPSYKWSLGTTIIKNTEGLAIFNIITSC